MLKFHLEEFCDIPLGYQLALKMKNKPNLGFVVGYCKP